LIREAISEEEGAMPISPALEPFRLSITLNNAGTEVLVYATATGCGIYLLQRIVVCTGTANSSICRFFRPGGAFDYVVGGAQIEPNITILKASVPAMTSPFEAFADGHYIRIDRRATTPVETF
jgi:hypothetical protein